ncbi:MAG TPA: thioesterase family protein [Waddliaceae bacterium]
MFIAKNKVRMHDTDVAGVLYFARQFRFAHDALEDFVESEGFDFDRVFHKENFVFVIVHCEADYYAPLRVGDKLDVHVTVEKVGSSSFTMNYRIYRGELKVGSAKTVHVTLEKFSRKKIPIPPDFLRILKHHVETPNLK